MIWFKLWFLGNGFVSVQYIISVLQNSNNKKNPKTFQKNPFFMNLLVSLAHFQHKFTSMQ